MAVNSGERQDLGSNQLSPIEMLAVTTSRFSIVWLVIPIGFILFKLAGVSILSASIADAIVDAGKFICPMLPQQYEEIRRSVSSGEAANYAAFMLLLFLFHVFLAAFIFAEYALKKQNFSVPRARDNITALLCMFGASYAALFDNVKASPKPFWNFYIDSFGLYYFRQEGAFSVILLFWLMILSLGVNYAYAGYLKRT